LEPHGRWSHHDRWGEVWIPAHEEEEWAPYTRGRWVYTDDWGWYWVSADEEADWGWVTFHYGRWVYDDEGWIWIPGREWAPAWVTWRRGGDRIGWAPQPPDEIYIEIRDNPRYWVFVEPRDFVSVTLWTEVEPAWRHTELLQQTVIVNRTVIVRERGSIIAVNPGIEPAIIAREVGEPIRTYEVRPRVLAGTAEIKDAIEVRPGEAPGELKKQEPVVRETRNLIEPAKTEQPPQALAPDEKGRLGERPPRAAEGVAPGEESEKKAEEPSKAEGPGKKAEEPTKPEPSKKAEEPSKREEPGKKAEEPSRAEQPGKKAEEPSKREEQGKKAEEPSRAEQPGKKAEEPSKREEPGKKAEEPSKAEQPGKKAEQPIKREEPGKRAEEPSKAEQPGKKAEQPSKTEQPGKRAEEKDKGKADEPAKKAEQPSKPEGSGKKAEEKGKGAGKKAEGSGG
jgi:hypothetical protein